jgi:hypothetical protein
MMTGLVMENKLLLNPTSHRLDHSRFRQEGLRQSSYLILLAAPKISA